MKRIFYLAVVIIIAAGCQGTGGNGEKNNGKKESGDSIQVKKYYNEGRLVKEVTFKNDVKNGICRNYYADGRLKRTIWYESGLKEDTARWFYREGKIYRSTPYRNDKIHGVQTKYYKKGRVQATIPYTNGFRAQGLKEYLPDGRKAETYPVIVENLRDLMDTGANLVRVFVRLSNESVNVRFYRGSLTDGVFDPEKCRDITTSSGMGFMELKPDAGKGKGYVSVIAVYTTRFRNKKIITKKINLPYNNLN